MKYVTIHQDIHSHVTTVVNNRNLSYEARFLFVWLAQEASL